MPSGHRKKPFSSKQKKEQLKSKREKKKFQERDEFGTSTVQLDKNTLYKIYY